MTTETLTKLAATSRVPSVPARTESPPKKPNYESGYLPQPIEYPDSDGQPMAESDFQFEPLSYAVESLKIRFQDRPDVYVAGNIFFYYEEGQPAKVVAPDVLVVIGAEKRKRHSVKLWEEPKAPDFVLEITSKSTRSQDQGSKKGTYEFLGVTEYFCYDPTGDYLDPPLLGYRLKDGLYAPITPKVLSADTVVVPSQTLGIDLHVSGREFRFVDPITGQALRNLSESEQQRIEEQRLRIEERRLRIEEQRLRIEEQRLRIEAESKVRELEARLAASEKESPR